MTWEIVRHDLRPGGGEAVVVEVHATRAEGERRILELRQERERGSPYVHALRQHRIRSNRPDLPEKVREGERDLEAQADAILRNAGHGALVERKR